MGLLLSLSIVILMIAYFQNMVIIILRTINPHIIISCMYAPPVDLRPNYITSSSKKEKERNVKNKN